MSNRLDKFNNEYLKCVVTENKKTIDLLKDSGSMIIHNEDDERNSMYLGNEFVASGHGFSNRETLDKAKELVNEFDSVKESLKQGIIKNAENIDEEIAKTNKKFSDYVLSKGGNISNTNIEYIDNIDKNVKLANAKDVILHGPEAQYEDATIEYKNYIRIIENGSSLEKEIILDDNEIIELPIGTTIRVAGTKFILEANDTGGILQIDINYIYYDLSSNAYKQTSKFIKSISLKNGGTVYEEDASVYYINDLRYTVKEGVNTVIDSTVITLAETPDSKLKNYPELEGYNITSSSNKIRKHTITIPGISVKGLPTIFVKTDKEASELSTSSLSKYNQIMIHKEDVHIDNIKQETKYINILCPFDKNINKIEFYDKSNRRYHNWTGSFKVYRSLQDNDSVVKLQIGNYYYYPYDAYTIEISKGINKEGSLVIHLIDSDNIDSENTVKGTSDKWANGTMLISDEYTSEYWIDYNVMGDSYIKEVAYTGAN